MFCPKCGKFMTAIRKTPLRTQSIRQRVCSNKACQAAIKTVESYMMETLSDSIPEELAEAIRNENKQETDQLEMQLQKKSLNKTNKKDKLKEQRI